MTATFTCKECGATFEREHNGRGRFPVFCADCRRAHDKERKRKWRKANPDKVRALEKRKKLKYTLRLYVDPEFYAHHRAPWRERRLRYDAHMRAIGKWPPRKLNGREYRPTPSRRFPDWAVKGQCVIDFQSPWLAENMTPEQKAFARELFIERREKMRAAP